jgi:hypothetical protein
VTAAQWLGVAAILLGLGTCFAGAVKVWRHRPEPSNPRGVNDA